MSEIDLISLLASNPSIIGMHVTIHKDELIVVIILLAGAAINPILILPTPYFFQAISPIHRFVYFDLELHV